MLQRIKKLCKRTWANWRFAKNADVKLSEAMISFTFDDAPSSAFRSGGKLLSEQGYGGTFYIAMSLLDQPESKGGFSKDDLTEALEGGHELACHTYGHIDVSSTAFKAASSDIAYNQSAVEKLIPGLQFEHFSYPFGSQTKSIKEYLSRHFKTARGISHGLNVGKTDLTNLKTVKLYRDRHSLSEIEDIIQKAQDEKAWLIFYTHDVKESPTDYGCNPNYFSSVIQVCKERSISIYTIDQAYKKIRNA